MPSFVGARAWEVRWVSGRDVLTGERVCAEVGDVNLGLRCRRGIIQIYCSAVNGWAVCAMMSFWRKGCQTDALSACLQTRGGYERGGACIVKQVMLPEAVIEGRRPRATTEAARQKRKETTRAPGGRV